MSTLYPPVSVATKPFPLNPSGIGTFFPKSLLNGLVAYWPLNEQSGDRYDVVGKNHLTDTNTVGYAAGKNGNAGSVISANTEYLVRTDPDLGITPQSGYTVAGWVYSDSASAPYSSMLASLIKSWSSDYTFAIYANSTTMYQFFGSQGVAYASLSNVTFDAWNFVVAWYTPLTSKAGLQINNGIFVESAAAAIQPITPGSQLFLGAYPVSVTGKMDEIGIWSRPLDADERAALYNSGAGLFYPFA